jgi:hypothetical protein
MREPNVYPPGWFLEPVRAWVSMGFTPSIAFGMSQQKSASLAAATEKSNEAREAGKGWATGTVVMPNTPTHKAPGWMDR